VLLHIPVAHQNPTQRLLHYQFALLINLLQLFSQKQFCVMALSGCLLAKIYVSNYFLQKKSHTRMNHESEYRRIAWRRVVLPTSPWPNITNFIAFHSPSCSFRSVKNCSSSLNVVMLFGILSIGTSTNMKQLINYASKVQNHTCS
jgi:hypothetical protein